MTKTLQELADRMTAIMADIDSRPRGTLTEEELNRLEKDIVEPLEATVSALEKLYEDDPK
jgi:hypothetical protein